MNSQQGGRDGPTSGGLEVRGHNSKASAAEGETKGVWAYLRVD